MRVYDQYLDSGVYLYYDGGSNYSVEWKEPSWAWSNTKFIHDLSLEDAEHEFALRMDQLGLFDPEGLKKY